MTIRKNKQDAPPLPTDAQPQGSGAVPGAAEKTFGERLKEGAAGQQVAPGVNDGTEQESEPMVTFHGAAGLREITTEQWQGAGVANMPTVKWERRTGFKVPKSAFTDQALQVLRQDQDFRVP